MQLMVFGYLDPVLIKITTLLQKLHLIHEYMVQIIRTGLARLEELGIVKMYLSPHCLTAEKANTRKQIQDSSHPEKILEKKDANWKPTV
ncbi:hypothetical protein IJ23_03200 [Vibrio sp. OY15]|nr:hypothetical protein IJ23_03200 [Vibrio sp. OY15]